MNILFLIFASLLSLALFLHPIDSDGDFFQHVNIGKYILQNHALPHRDNLTFTAFGKEYTAFAWLSGVIFYLIFTTVGPLGINILVLSAAILTFYLLYYFLKCLKINFKISTLTLLLIAPIIASRWPSRPEIFSYPIFLSFLILDQLQGKKPLVILLYPLLILLLVNLYGASFPKSMIKFIKDNNLSGRVLNPPRIGSFLEFYLSPQIQAFSDTRDDLFIGTDILEKMDLIQSLGASLDYFLLKYKINIIIASPADGNSYKDLLRSKTWVVVYFDNNYFIIVPKETAIKKHLYTLDQLDPYSQTRLKRWIVTYRIKIFLSLSNPTQLALKI